MDCFLEDRDMSQNTAIQTTNSNTVQVRPNTEPAQQETWSYIPPIDVLEWDQEYTIECDAPGLNAHEIDLSYEAGNLRLHGKVSPRYSQDVQFITQEYGVGNFDRVIALGRLAEFVDMDRLSAEYHDGVLTIHLRKLAAAQPRKVKVKCG
jgi:HSP20 family protein